MTRPRLHVTVVNRTPTAFTVSRQVVRRRRNLEYRLKRRTPRKVDYLRAIKVINSLTTEGQC